MPSSWENSLRELGFAEPARYSVVESWARSAATLLSRDGEVRFRRVDQTDLVIRQQNAADLIAAAGPRLARLITEIPGNTTVAYVTDADGIVLLSYGNVDQIEIFGLSPGYDWSECAMGTNGAGTALAARKPVAVVGPEHYLRAFENCTCTASPIFGALRTLVGAIDVSSSVEEASPERLSDVIATAFDIEQELYARAFPKSKARN